MSFTFQINEGMTFNRNEKWLKIAEENRPKLIKTEIHPTRAVEIVENKESIGGYSVADSPKKIEELKNHYFKKGDKYILDFGDHYVGHFKVDIQSVGSPMDAPLHLKLTFAETPAETVMDARDYAGWLSSSWIAQEILHVDVLPITLEMPRRYSFRYVVLEVLDTSPKWQVSFHNPVVTSESAVNMGDVELLDTEDELLRAIDRVSLKTLADCMQDVFEDGPKRDQRLWMGDLRLQALANYKTFNQIGLVKRCLYLFAAVTTTEGKVSANVFTKAIIAADDTFLFDYSLFFVSCLKDYYENTMDKETLLELYSVAKGQIFHALNEVDERGILTCPEDWPVFIDWSHTMDKATSAQAVLIFTMKQFIELANVVGDEQVSAYVDRLHQLESAARESLFSDELQMFVSGPNSEVNIASQVWMTLAEVLTEDESKELMKRTVEKLFPITGIATPYMYHHVVEALFKAGLTQKAIELLKSYWGKMIELGADTFWEAFMPEDPSYSPYGSPLVNSYCHAWSCTPAYLFREYLKLN